MEDRGKKSEDIEINNTIQSVCTQMSTQTTSVDTKSLVDNKNTQVRVVRGTKKFKSNDTNDSSIVEKKGVLLIV